MSLIKQYNKYLKDINRDTDKTTFLSDCYFSDKAFWSDRCLKVIDYNEHITNENRFESIDAIEDINIKKQQEFLLRYDDGYTLFYPNILYKRIEKKLDNVLTNCSPIRIFNSTNLNFVNFNQNSNVEDVLLGWFLWKNLHKNVKIYYLKQKHFEQIEGIFYNYFFTNNNQIKSYIDFNHILLLENFLDMQEDDNIVSNKSIHQSIIKHFEG
jgi:hypothetical protein